MSDRQANAWRHVFLGALSLLLLVPFYIAVVNAFKPKELILRDPLGIPFSELTIDAFIRSAVTSSFNIFEAYWTTALITVGSAFFIVILSSMMSYVIARGRSRFLSGTYLLLLAGLMIPNQVILIPIVKVLSALNLMFTPAGLILYNIGWYIPFTVFTYTGFIRTISPELDESAKIEGAGPFAIFWRVVFPLIRPATASVLIFLFLWVWNDFLNPLIILGSTRGYTVTTGLFRAIGQYSVNWDEVFALVVMASLPIMIMYLFMQRNFISGLTEGAIKG